MRKLRIAEPPDDFVSGESRFVNRLFDFELLTPMFGGGAESWKIDLKNPVRTQAVKGMLRFWWRTTQSENNPHHLLYKENNVWGGKTASASERGNRRQSPVKLAVIDQSCTHRVFQGEYNPANNNFIGVKSDDIPAYVLFPITDKIKNNEEIHYIDSLTFKLQVSYPKHLENDVLNTLKLWCLFGGVGARTRRGAGSIYCEELLKDFNSEKDVAAFLNSFAGTKDKLPYPRVTNSLFAVHPEASGDAKGIWRGLLTAFGDYRQKAGVGRGVGQGNRPGRSYWPEPDAIRRLTGKVNGVHAPSHPDGIWFPRAAFGLPILTEFRGEPTDPSGKYHLEPDIGTGERWPSPVVLKVFKLPNGTIYKTALVLNQEFPARLNLKRDNQVIHTLNREEMPTNIEGKVMKDHGSPLDGSTIYEHLISSLNLSEVI